MTHAPDDPRNPEDPAAPVDPGLPPGESDGASETSESPDVPAGWSQRITTAILLVAMLGLLVEIGIWAWDRLTAYGPGDPFPAVDVVSLEDGSTGVWLPAAEEDIPATLLVLFTTTCPVCQGNVTGWNALYDEVSSEVRMVGLSLDPADRTGRFVDALGVRFPVQVIADPEAFKEEISLPGVPLTVVLDADGGLVDYWYGPLGQELRSTIRGRLAELAPELSSSTSIEPIASRRRRGPHGSGQPRSGPLLGLS